MGAITYASGRVDTIETAVRRAVVSGVNQTAAKAQWQLADEVDCDLMEVSAHGGARPEHAAWQGGVYSRGGKSKKYRSLRAATGYGTAAGLCGVNCGHTFGPYVEGMPRTWTQERLDALEEKRYTYNGGKLTEYEAREKQRKLENNIRRWKRENLAMKAAGLDTTESAAKIKQWRAAEADFRRQTGFKIQSARTQVGGFGRSEAAKATQEALKAQKTANSIFSLGSSEANLKAYLKEKPVIDTLSSQGVKYIQRINAKEVIVDAGKPTITGMRVHAIENLTGKADRAAMTQEKAQSFVDTAKLTLYQQEKGTLKFVAVDGYAALNFTHELVTAVPEKIRRKYARFVEGAIE